MDFDRTINFGEGKIRVECTTGAMRASAEIATWDNFSSRVEALEQEWIQEIQVLAKQWRGSRGYFRPYEDVVQAKLASLRRVSGSIGALVEDMEANAGTKQAAQFFVSYSHQDAAVVDRLSTGLRRRGFSVWRDSEQIRVGESIRRRIEQGIGSSTFLLLVLSPHSVNSTWVADEIDMAISLEKQLNRIILLPVIASSCELPLVLRGRRWVSLTDYERGLTELLANLPTSHAS